MASQLGELSEEEIDLIVAHRKEIQRRRDVDQKTLAVLNIAAGYEYWLQKNGRGSSFSTFNNEFGGYNGDNSSAMFKVVESLRIAAQNNVLDTFF